MLWYWPKQIVFDRGDSYFYGQYLQYISKLMSKLLFYYMNFK